MMANFVKSVARFVFLFVFFTTINTAQADTTFYLSWSGASLGNSTRATGYITITPAGMTTMSWPSNAFFNTSNVSAFSITVTGAGANNGTWSLADYASSPHGGINYFAPGALNLDIQLVGQNYTNSSGFFGPGDTNPNPSYFLLDHTTPSPLSRPYSAGDFTLMVGLDGDPSTAMVLTSFDVAPEIDGRFLPQTLLLMGGLTLIGRRGRRNVLSCPKVS